MVGGLGRKMTRRGFPREPGSSIVLAEYFLGRVSGCIPAFARAVADGDSRLLRTMADADTGVLRTMPDLLGDVFGRMTHIAGAIGDSPMSLPSALSAPSSSVSIQFAIVRPERSPGCAFTTASKYSASGRSETIVRASSGDRPCSRR